MPQVSVVINTYNSAKYLVATVESVLAQTFRDYELIVVDDGSTDNTREVLTPYQDRLIYIHQENKKYSAARNTGIRASSGQYIAFLDSDDIWRPDKLERQVPILDQHPEVALVYCQVAYMDPQGNPVQFRGKWTYGSGEPGLVIVDKRRELFMGTVVSPGSIVVVRHSGLDQAGLFDEGHIHGEDWELWVRLATTGLFAYIPEPLTRYRVYGWNRVLNVEASEAWLADQLKSIKTAVSVWQGDPEECNHLRDLGLARIHLHGALASYQIGKLEQGREKLAQATSYDPRLASRDAVVNLAIDRAREIEIEFKSLESATTFVEAFFSNLPEGVAQFASARRQALAWLYVGIAFDRQKAGDSAAARRLLQQACICWPACLTNRGVLSVASEAWLGKDVTSRLKKAARGWRRSKQESMNV